MDEADRDMPLRLAAFDHVRRLGEVHDHLTATERASSLRASASRSSIRNVASSSHSRCGPVPSFGPRRHLKSATKVTLPLSVNV